MPDFVEVGDRVWLARYEWMDVNVTAIGSDRGLVVVDTHGSTAAGRHVLSDLDRLGAGPIAHVVNSHWHWDHSFGNAAFRESARDVPIHAHEEAAVWLAEQGVRMKQRFAESDDPRGADVVATELVIPDRTFADTQTLDLGDRSVELAFFGRGHTSGDIVAKIPDVDLVVAGDLIEESANPWIGMDSWPLEWPATLSGVLNSLSEQTLVIPGHGAVVGRDFVSKQCDEIAQIVAMVKNLAQSGVSVDDAPSEGEWPWETDDRIRNAVRRGYEEIQAAADQPL